MKLQKLFAVTIGLIATMTAANPTEAKPSSGPNIEPGVARANCQYCESTWEGSYWFAWWGDECDPSDHEWGCSPCPAQQPGGCVGSGTSYDPCDEQCWFEFDYSKFDVLAMMKSGNAGLIRELFRTQPGIAINEQRKAIQLTSACGAVIASFPLDEPLFAQLQAAR